MLFPAFMAFGVVLIFMFIWSLIKDFFSGLFSNNKTQNHSKIQNDTSQNNKNNKKNKYNIPPSV